jgi:hypothetical protein
MGDIVFFVDRSLGGRIIVQGLRDAGHKVHAHDDHFRHNTPDEEWLEFAGRKEWVVLSKDRMIRRRASERQALNEAGIRAFFLAAKDMKGTDMLAVFLRHMPAIITLAKEHPPPFIALVNRNAVDIEYQAARARSPRR